MTPVRRPISRSLPKHDSSVPIAAAAVGPTNVVSCLSGATPLASSTDPNAVAARDDASNAGNESRPNIVMIVSDDHAWTDYGFAGHPAISTPHLDRLAAESLTFTRGYVPTGLCRPSLASMITGRWPHEHGIVGNDPSRLPGMTGRDDPAYLARCAAMIDRIDRYPTLPRLLAPLGYASFQSGKWWEGSAERGGFTAGMTHGDPARGGRHGDHGLTIGRQGMAEVTAFIDSHRELPFFLWYAPFLPHEPHTPPERLLEHYLVEGVPPAEAKYRACVEWFDETCGELLDHLESAGVAERTIVVYVTDNGWIQRTAATEVPEGWRQNFAPRSKQSPNEVGVRTPIMIRWPGRVPARRDESTVVSSVDLVPTLLHAVGGEVPDGMPGVDLLERNGEVEGTALAGREAIFGEHYAHDVVLEDDTARLLTRWTISGRWKLLISHRGDITGHESLHGGRKTAVQLYDLLADPHEERNLAAEQPGEVERLRELLDAWWAPERPAVFE